MATGKRYYWIKLKDSFMSSDEIDYLMSQPDGAKDILCAEPQNEQYACL